LKLLVPDFIKVRSQDLESGFKADRQTSREKLIGAKLQFFVGNWSNIWHDNKSNVSVAEGNKKKNI
jgi:hypothetical protein